MFKDYDDIHAMLAETVARRGAKNAYRWFDTEGGVQTVSWDQFYDQVRQAAGGLIRLGIKKGDKIAILSYSNYRWVLTDLAAACIGAVTVGIYQTLLAGDCRYILQHSDSVLCFVQDRLQLDKLQTIRSEIPEIRRIVLMDEAVPDEDWVMGYDEFLARGQDVPNQTVTQMAQAVSSGDLAAIVYTSGTTGVPKGAMLTHDNMTYTAQSVEKSVVWYPDDEVFLFLPLAHVFARTCVYTTLLSGCSLTFCRSMDTLAEDLKSARPHWFPSVPRVFEKVHAKITSGAEAKGGLALKLFNWAMAVGGRVSDLKLRRQPVPSMLALKYRLATKLVFSKIQAALGGRVRWCISGAAPLNPDIGKFFHAAGILIVEGIGMTENTSFSNLNRYDDYRFGWVGPPGPGIEQKVTSDGEVLFRGRNVMKGYYKMPEETAQTITADGWLKTGDLGEIDSQNFLRITGRKKEILVTSGGKNISPASIEGQIALSKYINQVCVVGDRRHYLTALISLDPETIKAFADEQKIGYDAVEDLHQHPLIIDLIEKEIESKNLNLASFETIKKFCVVPEFSIDNGMLTPTLKLKKNVVLERYRQEIETMY